MLLEALLNSSSLDDVSAGLDDIQFNETVIPGALIRNLIQLLLMQAVDITDVSEPRVQQAQVRRGKRSLDASTIVVATDDDVLDVQMSYRVVDYGHGTEIGIGDEIGDVAMHEDFPGPETHDLVGGDAAITATNVARSGQPTMNATIGSPKPLRSRKPG